MNIVSFAFEKLAEIEGFGRREADKVRWSPRQPARADEDVDTTGTKGWDL